MRILIVMILLLSVSLTKCAEARRHFGVDIRPEIYVDLTEDEDYEPVPLPWPMRITITAYDKNTGLQVAGPVETVSSEDLIALRYTETITEPAQPADEEEGLPEKPESITVNSLDVITLVDPVMGSSVDLKCVIEAVVVEQGRQREMKASTTVPCQVGRECPLTNMGSLDIRVKVEWVDR